MVAALDFLIFITLFAMVVVNTVFRLKLLYAVALRNFRNMFLVYDR